MRINREVASKISQVVFITTLSGCSRVWGEGMLVKKEIKLFLKLKKDPKVSVQE